MSNTKFTDFESYALNHPELREKINDGIMEKEFASIHGIYIDLVLLKDTRLGLMIGLAKQRDNEDQVKYLIDNISKYNTRPNRSFTIAYPDYMLNEAQLKKQYNKVNSVLAFDYAPDTALSVNLGAELSNIFMQNTRSGYTKPITVTINTFPLAITESMKTYGKILEHTFHQRIKINFVTLDPESIGLDFWLLHKVIFLDNLEAITVTNKITRTSIFDKHEWMNIRLVCPYSATDEVIEYWISQGSNVFNPKELNDLELLTSTVMGICTVFEFKFFTIPVGDNNE